MEDVLEALNNKNPSVKTETSLFLARAFTKTVPVTVNKRLLKTVTSALIKTINESGKNNFLLNIIFIGLLFHILNYDDKMTSLLNSFGPNMFIFWFLKMIFI